MQKIQKTTSEEENTFEGLEVNAIAFVYIGFSLNNDHEAHAQIFENLERDAKYCFHWISKDGEPIEYTSPISSLLLNEHTQVLVFADF